MAKYVLQEGREQQEQKVDKKVEGQLLKQIEDLKAKNEKLQEGEKIKLSAYKGVEKLGTPHKHRNGRKCFHVGYEIRWPSGIMVNEVRYGPGKMVLPQCLVDHMAWQDSILEKNEYVLYHRRDLGTKSTGTISGITLS